MTAVGPWLFAFCLLTTACTEDINDTLRPTSKESQPIIFTVDDSQDWEHTTVDTRSAKHLFVPKTTQMTINGVPTDMFLRTTIVNGIANQRIDAAVTRGVAQTTLGQDFNVLAYVYNGSETWGNQSPSYTAHATKTGTSTWTLDDDYYWPEEGSVVRFVGYTPATPSGSMTVSAVGDSPSEPTIDYTVTTTVAEQTDLMTAISQETTWRNFAGKIKMPFKHALTCVKFSVGSAMRTDCTIKAIRLRNIAKKGILTIGETDSWQADATSRTDFFMENVDFSTIGTELNTIIAPAKEGGEQETTLLMIPQTFDNDAQRIEVELMVNGTSQSEIVSATLSGQEWQPGTTVTYQLSTKASDLNYVLTASSAILGHRGGMTTFTITSYAEDTGIMGGVTALPWRVIGYSADEGRTYHTEKPASCNWVGISTTSGSGGAESQTGLAIMDPQTITKITDLSTNAVQAQQDTLANSPVKGSATDFYDLSTHDLMGNVTVMNTANCYVVNAPGYYKLPLVYGNSVKNGATNAIAYSGTQYNHDNVRITSPYIWEKYTANDCILCWQDADGLVSDVNLSSDGKYLTFKVTKSTITPGNALVAVRGAGNTIMWSWHIWVTPIDILATKKVKNAQGYHYEFMPVNLGWCATNGKVASYTSRSMYVKVLQEASGLTATFRISQNGGVDFVESTRGYNTYYQWGRKDPMLPLREDYTANNHAQYPTGGSYLWRSYTGGVDIRNTIMHPNYFYTGQWTWHSGTTPDWWILGSSIGTGIFGHSDATIVKTIWDPSPVGFHVPPSNAFTYFTTTGNSTTSTSQIRAANIATYTADRGYFFYTDATQTETMFVPATGYRNATNGNPVMDGTYGYLRTAMPNEDGKQAYCFRIESTGVYPWSDHTRAFGGPVRPVADY